MTENQVRKIEAVTCLLELDGYEAQAKSRGISPEEMQAIHIRRKVLTPKKRRVK